MKKKICLIIILLVVLIINANAYHSLKYVDNTTKNYVCKFNINNSDYMANYDYVYNIETDSFDHIINSSYYEEFTYGDSDVYKGSKEYYLGLDSGYRVEFDDSKKVLKLCRDEVLLDYSGTYDSFKEFIEETNFKCEEQL